ncbi:thioredoxin [Lucifera butyrica]|uniref:Thioredoxin n=2 Tax=Lucifera butyrica TaxID=1351585 RepID=A0A498RE54_9FIRM|nr:thioredoxin [Lucifera butyrica]
MKKNITKILVFMLLLLFPYNGSLAAEPDCGCDAVSGPLYKGFSLSQDTGYFAREFDKNAASPGLDWTGDSAEWLTNASANGWIIETSPEKAKAGALILGQDSTGVWVGIVRNAANSTVSYEAFNEQDQPVLFVKDVSSLRKSLLGYIYPAKQPRSDKTAQAIRGNPAAPVTVVEYVDFQCPHCARAKPVVDQVLKKYGGQVKLELKHRPLAVHPFAIPAARTFQALYSLNTAKAWQFYDLAMAEQPVLKTGAAGLQTLVNKLGLTPEEKIRLSVDSADTTLYGGIAADIAEADSLGLKKVPAFFINGIPLKKDNSVNDFSLVIDPLLRPGRNN